MLFVFVLFVSVCVCASFFGGGIVGWGWGCGVGVWGVGWGCGGYVVCLSTLCPTILFQQLWCMGRFDRNGGKLFEAFRGVKQNSPASHVCSELVTLIPNVWSIDSVNGRNPAPL